jgi:hypothetical protein
MLRQYFRAVACRNHPDATERQVPHQDSVCGKDFPLYSWMGHPYVVGRFLVVDAEKMDAPQILVELNQVVALTFQGAAHQFPLAVGVDAASLQRTDYFPGVVPEDVEYQKDYFQGVALQGAALQVVALAKSPPALRVQ